MTGCPVLAERTLLQPFDLLLAVERNLCPWYTKIPTVDINLNMNNLKVHTFIIEIFRLVVSLAMCNVQVLRVLQTTNHVILYI